MKNDDCLFSDIQNLSNAVSDWLIQKINNLIETCVITAEPVNSQQSTVSFFWLQV